MDRPGSYAIADSRSSSGIQKRKHDIRDRRCDRLIGQRPLPRERLARSLGALELCDTIGAEQASRNGCGKGQQERGKTGRPARYADSGQEIFQGVSSARGVRVKPDTTNGPAEAGRYDRSG